MGEAVGRQAGELDEYKRTAQVEQRVGACTHPGHALPAARGQASALGCKIFKVTMCVLSKRHLAWRSRCALAGAGLKSTTNMAAHGRCLHCYTHSYGTVSELTCASVHSSPAAASGSASPAAAAAAAWLPLAGRAVGCSPSSSRYRSADCTMGLPATQCANERMRRSVKGSKDEAHDSAAPAALWVLLPVPVQVAVAVGARSARSALLHHRPHVSASHGASGVQGSLPGGCCAPGPALAATACPSVLALRRETSPPPSPRQLSPQTL